MRRRHKHQAHEEHENHERWLVSYADMITVLMAFFIMLYGMSILDLKKFAEFKAGIAGQSGQSPVVDGGPGILVAGRGITDVAAPPVGPTPGDGGAGDGVEVRGEATREDIDALASEVRERLRQNGLEGKATASADPRGLVVYLPDEVLFDSGSALIALEGQPVLDQVAAVLAHIDNTFQVEGHTDDVPTRGTQWPTNWELSTARATNVLRYLTEVRDIPAPRAGAAGYADMRPRVPNDSAAHRSLNRRVELVIVIPPEESTDGQEIQI